MQHLDLWKHYLKSDGEHWPEVVTFLSFDPEILSLDPDIIEV